ncbi:MAG: choice-of-anchor Q domain-containing protein [Dokdonella sp.]
MKARQFPSWIAAGLCAVCVNTASAGDLFVGSAIDSPSGHDCSAVSPCSLREALTLAHFSASDTRILVSAPQVQLTTTLTILNDPARVDIIGTLAVPTRIYGTTGGRVMRITNARIGLRNLDIENGIGGVSIGVSPPGISTLDLVSVVFKNNNAFNAGSDRDGGGLKSVNAAVTMQSVTFDNNVGILGGGAFISGGSVRIEDCSFHGNHASSAGGLLVQDAATTIERSTFDGNAANDLAGGIYLSLNNRPLLASNLTIANNAVNGAPTLNAGGLLLAYSNATANQGRIDNLTMSGNMFSSSGTGGSLVVANAIAGGISDMRIDNSIVQGICAPGTSILGSHDIESPGNTCALDPLTSQVAVSSAQLALGLLGDNGGPNLTQEPAAGSVAIDAGLACETVDQRGFARNVGACDVGAVEVGAMAVVFADGFDN